MDETGLLVIFHDSLTANPKGGGTICFFMVICRRVIFVLGSLGTVLIFDGDHFVVFHVQSRVLN